MNMNMNSLPTSFLPHHRLLPLPYLVNMKSKLITDHMLVHTALCTGLCGYGRDDEKEGETELQQFRKSAVAQNSLLISTQVCFPEI